MDNRNLGWGEGETTELESRPPDTVFSQLPSLGRNSSVVSVALRLWSLGTGWSAVRNVAMVRRQDT
jgi:hypothetical protein